MSMHSGVSNRMSYISMKGDDPKVGKDR